MRTTVEIDDELLSEAQQRVQAPTKKALIEMALRALLRELAYQRLSAAGGTLKDFDTPRRRRPKRSS